MLGIDEMSSESELYEKLESSYMDDALGNKRYIPWDVIDKAINKETVEVELRRARRHRVIPGWAYPRRKIERIDGAKRVFAILVQIEEAHTFARLLSEGLTDRDLPLARQEDGKGLYSLHHSERIFYSFSARGSREFVKNQWFMLAPVFRVSTCEDHINLDPLRPLPFSKASEEDETRTNGHSSVVYKFRVHQAHQDGFEVRNSLCVYTTRQMILIEADRRKP